MTYTKDVIKDILQHPYGKTGNVDNSFLIGRMLVALYDRQTSQEQAAKTTRNVNGVGFNMYDALFLSKMAITFKKYNRFIGKQAAAVAKALIKYSGQLEDIAQSKQLPTPVTVPVKPVEKEVLDVPTYGNDKFTNIIPGDDDILEV